MFLNDSGGLENAYMVIPELRGFEKFCENRPVEEMPRITQRICGVCPIAHHIAAAKAGDAVYHVEPPPTARKLRELMYSAFFIADHATHFYVLGGPDFIVGPEAPRADRNIIGVVKKVGREIGSQVMQLLKGQPYHHCHHWREVYPFCWRCDWWGKQTNHQPGTADDP